MAVIEKAAERGHRPEMTAAQRGCVPVLCNSLKASIGGIGYGWRCRQLSWAGRPQRQECGSEGERSYKCRWQIRHCLVTIFDFYWLSTGHGMRLKKKERADEWPALHAALKCAHAVRSSYGLTTGPWLVLPEVAFCTSCVFLYVVTPIVVGMISPPMSPPFSGEFVAAPATPS
jgi:hypothetical protein